MVQTAPLIQGQVVHIAPQYNLSLSWPLVPVLHQSLLVFSHQYHFFLDLLLLQSMQLLLLQILTRSQGVRVYFQLDLVDLIVVWKVLKVK